MGDDSTTAELAHEPVGHVGRWSGRLGILLLVLLVVAGLTGLFGPRTATKDASGGGYRLEVEYPSIGRAGQPSALHVRVHHPGGFPNETVQLGLCDDLFDALDYQNWYPNPSAETGGSDQIVYEFDRPPGDTLEVSLDARVGPGELGGKDTCEVAVLDQGQPLVSLEFTSWRLP